MQNKGIHGRTLLAGDFTTKGKHGPKLRIAVAPDHAFAAMKNYDSNEHTHAAWLNKDAAMTELERLYPSSGTRKSFDPIEIFINDSGDVETKICE